MNTTPTIFTVITPTYNRANTLVRVYNSLRSQTLQNFEWIVIDDGSTDNTSEVIESFKREAEFEITYKLKKNGGVHTARNMGIPLAQGKYCAMLDSDDELVSDALENIYKIWSEIDDEYAVIWSRCTLAGKSEVLGPLFQDNMNSLNKKKQNKFLRMKKRGEALLFTKTEILQKYSFPEYGGIKFIPESSMWDQIFRDYKTFYTNRITRIYYQDQENQYSKQKNKMILYSAYLYYLLFINDIFTTKNYTLYDFLDKQLRLAYAAVRVGIPFKAVIGKMKNQRDKIFFSISYLMALLLAKITNNKK